MTLRFGNARLLAAVGAASLALLAPATPALAHGTGDSHDKRQQFLDGVSVPIVSSPNVRFVGNFPDTAAIAGVFAKSAPYFYVSSTDSINVFDVSDPLRPKLTGALANVVFENEAINYGETKTDGVVNRFVLVGVDLGEFSPTQPSHVGISREVMVVDVTDPTNPRIRSYAKTSTSTHTISCIRETDCRYAYTAGGRGAFSVIDLTNLDAPREIGVFSSSAAGPNAVFTRGAGHKWNFDNAGYGLHTGSGGTAVFDVSDPTNPKVVNTTDANGVTGPWNDFIHHNSDRPNASKFAAGAAPSVDNGNVLLITEEDYENTDCATAGSFQTWYVDQLAGGSASITPLDRINPVDLGEGVSTPNMAFCSAHWFDYHQSGIVAQGFYQGGLRLIDVRDPRNLTEYGYVASGLSEVWDAYWVPQRNKNGVATGSKTNIVYTADFVRGLDVYTVDLPGTTTTTPLLGGVGAGGTGPTLLALLVAAVTGVGLARFGRRPVAVEARRS